MGTRKTLAIIVMLLTFIATACSNGETTSNETDREVSGEGSAESEESPGSEAGGGSADEIVVGTSGLGSESFDPARSASNNKPYLALIYDYLVGTDQADGEISKETGIAQDWTISEDNLTYTFQLREDAVFSNGDPVTAADAKFSLERLGEEGVIGSFAPGIIGMIESIETPDDYTLVVNLNQPTTVFAEMISTLGAGGEGMVVPVDYVNEVGLEQFNREPVGSGPYVLAEHVPGSEIVLQAREEPHHVVGTPAVRTIRLRLVPEENSRLSQLQSGQLDLIDVSRENLEEVESAGFRWVTKPSGETLNIMFPPHARTPELEDINVRKALSLAIDREALAESVFSGYAEPTGNFMTEAVIGFEELPPDPYDPEEAQRLLAEAGYQEGDIHVEWQSYAFIGMPEVLDVAQAVQGYWERIGVEATITYREYASYREEWVAGTLAPGTAQLNIIGAVPMPTGRFNLYTTCEAWSTMVCDETLDQMTSSLISAESREEFEEQAAAIEARAKEMYAYISLVKTEQVYAASEAVPEHYTPGSGIVGLNLRSLVWDGS